MKQITKRCFKGDILKTGFTVAVLCLFVSIFIFTKDNQPIERVQASSGDISTIAGGNADGNPAVDIGINPYGVAKDGDGNLYIADYENHRIRKVNTSGIITTVAGVGVHGYSGDGGGSHFS